MSYWRGKAAIVTGGSSGLGLAIAKALVQTGAKVVIAARTEEKLRQAAAALGGAEGQVLPIVCDVTRDDDVQSLIDQTRARFGGVDLLVNNAGRSSRGEALATSPEDFARSMELNFYGLVRCTRAAAPLLLERRGHVINIGSLSAKVASRYMGPYAATKFAVAAYSQQLRLELGPKGLHVLLVCPGPIATKEKEGERLVYSEAELAGLPETAQRPGAGAKVKLLDADHLAREILRASERNWPELVRPRKARLLFILSAISPRLGDWLLKKMT